MIDKISDAARLAVNYVAENSDLAPLPFFMHLVRAFARDDAGDVDMRLVIEAVENEPMITAKLIAYAESPYYGPLSMATVASAIYRLGENKARRVLLALSLHAAFKSSVCPAFDLKAHWISAVYTAYMAPHIGGCVMVPEICTAQSSHEWYTLGLLHNIGLRCLVQYEPDTMDELLTGDGDLCQGLSGRFGFDHYDLAGALLAHWGLPERFHVAMQHVPDTAYRGPCWGISAVIDAARSQSPGDLFNAECLEDRIQQWGLTVSGEVVIASDEVKEVLTMAEVLSSPSE